MTLNIDEKTFFLFHKTFPGLKTWAVSPYLYHFENIRYTYEVHRGSFQSIISLIEQLSLKLF